MMITKRITNTVYIFKIVFANRVEVIQLESNSKTYALDYFFNYIDLTQIDLYQSECHYFSRSGDLKTVNLVEAFKRRKERGVL